MGCDIHLYIEHKPSGGDTWFVFAENVSLTRNYRAFSRLAGVRGDEKPVVQPRGFPEDAAMTTREIFDSWERSGHTPTWLSVDEWESALSQLHQSVTVEYHATTASMRALESGGSKARVVFWFDS